MSDIQTLLLIDEQIMSLSEEKQEQVKKCIETVKEMIQQHGECGILAFAYMGAYLAAQG